MGTEVMRIHSEDKRRAAVLGALRGQSAADFIHRAIDYFVEHNTAEIAAALQRAQRIALSTDHAELAALLHTGTASEPTTTESTASPPGEAAASREGGIRGPGRTQRDATGPRDRASGS